MYTGIEEPLTRLAASTNVRERRLSCIDRNAYEGFPDEVELVWSMEL